MNMAYSRFSDSEWYTYWCGESSEYSVELLRIYKRSGESSCVVWDEDNPAEMSDGDIWIQIPWKAFNNATPEEQNELVGYVREFFEDVYQQHEDMKLIDQVEWRV